MVNFTIVAHRNGPQGTKQTWISTVLYLTAWKVSLSHISQSPAINTEECVSVLIASQIFGMGAFTEVFQEL